MSDIQGEHATAPLKAIVTGCAPIVTGVTLIRIGRVNVLGTLIAVCPSMARAVQGARGKRTATQSSTDNVGRPAPVTGVRNPVTYIDLPDDLAQRVTP